MVRNKGLSPSHCPPQLFVKRNCGHVPCIRALIAAGADQGSSTALKIAREKGNDEAAEMLKLGTYVRAKSMWGPPRAGRF